MARKNNDFYFETFIQMGEGCLKAAQLLDEIMSGFDPDMIQEKMKQMHEIEHNEDIRRHELIERLMKEFLPPIEREDIMALADAIDTVTDMIEDVVMRMYMFNVKSVTNYAKDMAKVVVECCDAMKKALVEFKSFKKSQTLHDLIVLINNLEEKGDRLFTEATRDLHVNSKDHLEILAWEKIYNFLEICFDACEDVANEIEMVVLKNS